MTAKQAFKKRSKPTSLLGILLYSILLGLVAPATTAKQLYRYKNEQGNVVLSQSIPPKYVSKGYAILNEQGRIIETIAPALTQKQILARNIQRKKENQQRLVKQKQDLIDHELRQLYSHPNDAVRILRRRIQDIQDVTQVKKNKIESAQNQIRKNEAIAAQRQRKGLVIPDNILSKIVHLKKSITHSQHDIEELNIELKKVIAEFDVKIKRLEVITKHTASDYPALLRSIRSPEKKQPSSN